MQNKNSSPKDTVPPNNRLIVHNLSFETTKESLAQYFATYGNVLETEIPMNPKIQRSRGFGFVTFSSVEEATKANASESHEIDNRTVRTSFAKLREKDNASNEELEKGKKLYIGKLPEQINQEELKQYFEKFGTVEDAFLSTVKYATPVNGYPIHKGFGFVTFANEEDANKAVLVKSHLLKGENISVRKAKPQEEGKSPKFKKDNDNSSKEKKQLVVKRKDGKQGKSTPESEKKHEKKHDEKHLEKKHDEKHHEKKHETKKHEEKHHEKKHETKKHEEKKHEEKHHEKKQEPKKHEEKKHEEKKQDNKKHDNNKKQDTKKHEEKKHEEKHHEKKHETKKHEEKKHEEKHHEKKQEPKKHEEKKNSTPPNTQKEQSSPSPTTATNAGQKTKPKSKPKKVVKEAPKVIVTKAPAENPWSKKTSSPSTESSPTTAKDKEFPNLAGKKKAKQAKEQGKEEKKEETKKEETPVAEEKGKETKN